MNRTPFVPEVEMADVGQETLRTKKPKTRIDTLNAALCP